MLLLDGRLGVRHLDDGNLGVQRGTKALHDAVDDVGPAMVGGVEAFPVRHGALPAIGRRLRVRVGVAGLGPAQAGSRRGHQGRRASLEADTLPHHGGGVLAACGVAQVGAGKTASEKCKLVWSRVGTARRRQLGLVCSLTGPGSGAWPSGGRGAGRPVNVGLVGLLPGLVHRDACRQLRGGQATGHCERAIGCCCQGAEEIVGLELLLFGLSSPSNALLHK